MKITSVSELLKKLIDIPSVSGSESELGNFLADYLEEQGFDVRKQDVVNGRCNVFAKTGQPKVILQAHMDVVPPHIPAREDEQYIYGRGSCDTKGSIASMIVAAQNAKDDGVTDFGLLFTVDEEVAFAGAKSAELLVKETAAFLVVGEPTQLQPVTAHYGILVFSLVCIGKAAHSSEPQLGENAIDKLIALLAGPVKELQLSPKTLMSVVKISGGVADNVIPERAEAVLSFRIAPEDTSDYVQQLSQSIGDGGRIENVQSLPPVASELPKSLQFLGQEKQVKYCTELNFFKNGVVFGPGDIADAHTPNEKVKKEDVARAVELYQKVLTDYT